jgi:hypothetical protein
MEFGYGCWGKAQVCGAILWGWGVGDDVRSGRGENVA